MSILKSIILGIVQGITEFLPISSSGHLVIFQKLLGFKEPQLLLNVFLHFGTLIAVIIFYWDDIKRLLALNFEYNRERLLIILATIPTAIMGFGLKDIFEGLFGSIVAVGIALLITGILLWLVENININSNKSILELSWWHAILIGIAQGMAITPGVSRSGITIVAALFLGLSRKSAARFSFLIFIPAVVGATFLETLDIIETGILEMNFLALLLGTIVSAVVGYLSIKLLLKILEDDRLNYFAYYVWSLGALILIINFI
jgi:undecaprenyl-diphosphatase